MRSVQAAVLVVAIACARDASSKHDSGAASGNDPASAPGARFGEVREVAASPRAASELAPATGTVVDVGAAPGGGDAVVLVKTSSGGELRRWRIGANESSVIAALPPGFEPVEMATHPRRTYVLVSGRSAQKWALVAVSNDSGSWVARQVFETPNEISHLVFGPLPFRTVDGPKFRVFFASRASDGRTSTRSVTEEGTLEYQVAGAKQTQVPVRGIDGGDPNGPVVSNATPMAFHVNGQSLYWQDDKGCYQRLQYGESEWWKSQPLAGLPCGGSLGMTSNGRQRILWRNGERGIVLASEDGRNSERHAGTYAFVALPRSVLDGRGVLGMVSRNGVKAAVYVPIDIPLPDVANAWRLGGDSCDIDLFTTHSGLFRESKHDQLFTVYERARYGDAGDPALVTTDVFWEVFGSAYEGTFILLERRRAMPAFWAFVGAADSALKASAPASRWGRVFAAIADFHGGASTPEARRLSRDTSVAVSTAIDSAFDYGELKPRGHYTSSPEMIAYFRAVHYLTEMGRVIGDASPLASLPPAVGEKALRWIDVYLPFIAPSRAPVVWAPSVKPPAYTRDPGAKPYVFPLSWGFDNEVMNSLVFRRAFPAAQQIDSPNNARKYPSGLDIAAAYGSVTARALSEAANARYVRYLPMLDALIGRRPRPAGREDNLYDQWLSALAVEWADTASFPGVAGRSSLWNAKRLQTGLASWATIREATILVNERPNDAEAGEAGAFEYLIEEPPRGYVEPAPATFEAIASLFDGLAHHLTSLNDLGSVAESRTETMSTAWSGELQAGILARLRESAARARSYGAMAAKERRGEALTDAEYAAIQEIAGAAEHQFKIYKSLGNKDFALSTPDPMMKVADVFGQDSGRVEVAVGRPLEWNQIVPFFGRRQIVIGSVYSYHEFVSARPYDNDQWRRAVDSAAHPSWIAPFIAPRTCGAASR